MVEARDSVASPEAPATAALRRRVAALGERLGTLVNRRRVRAYSAIVLVVVVLEYGFVFLTGPGLLDRFGQIKGTDFIQFYVAGQLIAAGRGAELYGFELPFRFPVQFEAQTQLLMPQSAEHRHAYVVPPFYALLFVPLSQLPYVPAYGVWAALNVGLLFAALRVLRPHFAVLQGDDSGIAHLAVFSFFPFLECLFDGQNSVVTLFLFAAAYAALRRHRDAIAGVTLGLALYKPQLVGVMALFLLASRRWRAIVGLAGMGLLLAAISYAVVGPRGVADYVELAATMPGWIYLPGWRTWNMHSWNSLFVLLFPGPGLSQALTLAAVLVTLTFLALAWRSSAHDALGFDLGFALAVLGTLLISPHVFAYDLLLLVMPGLALASLLVAQPAIALTAVVARLRTLLALAYLAPLVSRFAAMWLHVQVSVLVLAAMFAATYLLATRPVVRSALVQSSAPLSGSA